MASTTEQLLYALKFAKSLTPAHPDIYAKLDEIADIIKEHEWISVKDRLPEDKTNCLCFSNSHGYSSLHMLTFYKKHRYECSSKNYFNKFWAYDSENGDFSYDDITHWRALPQPPQDTQEAHDEHL